MPSVASAPCAPLSLPRLFLPPITCRSDGCLYLGRRRNGRRLPVERPPLSATLISIRPSSSGRKQQFFELEDEDEVEEEDDDEDDDDVAAEEYVNGVLATGAFSEDGDEYAESEEEEVEVHQSSRSSSQYNHQKWQRVERLITEVREFGEEIIDFDELAGVYDFPIDKFQVIVGSFSSPTWELLIMC